MGHPITNRFRVQPWPREHAGSGHTGSSGITTHYPACRVCGGESDWRGCLKRADCKPKETDDKVGQQKI